MTSMNHHLRLLHQPIKILNTNSFHFISLSLLFLPLTFSITTIIQLHLSSADVTTILQTLTSFKNLPTLLIVIISTVIGTALITYSAHQAIYRTPLTFKSTFNSLSSSFTPLLSTFVALLIKITLVSLLLSLSSTVVNEFCSVLFLLLIVMVFHYVNWGSVPSVVVLEGKYGFEALRKSASQSVTVRVYSFEFLLFTGSMVGLMMYYCAVINDMESVSKWISIVQVGAYHFQSCMMVALYLVMNSVLYVWFKAGNGDDEKVKIVEKEGGGFTAKELMMLVHGGFSYMLNLFAIVAFISLYVCLH